MNDVELYHYGVPGMKWGVRRNKYESRAREARSWQRTANNVARIHDRKAKESKTFIGRAYHRGSARDMRKWASGFAKDAKKYDRKIARGQAKHDARVERTKRRLSFAKSVADQNRKLTTSHIKSAGRVSTAKGARKIPAALAAVGHMTMAGIYKSNQGAYDYDVRSLERSLKRLQG